jgi:hypothetical protein
MIPLVVHHVWPGLDTFRPELHDYRASWVKHHPDATFKFWRGAPADPRVRALLLDHRYTPTVKSDVLRWAVLVEEGGIYVDTDMECLAPLTKYLSDPCGCFIGDDDLHSTGTSIIGAKPQHPFVKRMVNIALDALANISPEEANTHPNLHIGPYLVTKVAEQYGQEITRYPFPVFYPTHYGNRVQAPLEEAVTIHHWMAEWKKRGPSWRESVVGQATPPRLERRQVTLPWVTEPPSPVTLAPVHERDRILVCHSAHERCGIREYGQQLDISLARHASVQSFTFKDTTALVQAVERGVTMLVHYEPALVPDGFVQTLRVVRERGARVVFCCHWYERERLQQYEEFVNAFVVHRDAPSHTIEVSLGCPTYSPSESRAEIRKLFGFRPDDIVVTTLGFLTRWKRVPQTIEALLSQAQDPNLVFRVQMPLHFTDQDASRKEEEAIRDVMGRYANTAGRRPRVQFSTAFIPEKDLLDLAHASDLGFIFHGENTKSVSAATKQFVSARTPLMITESTHGSDLKAGVVRVPGFDPTAFAREVLQVAGNAARRDALRAGIASEYTRINMDAVAERYLELFRGLTDAPAVPKHVAPPAPAPVRPDPHRPDPSVPSVHNPIDPRSMPRRSGGGGVQRSRVFGGVHGRGGK